MNLVWRDHCGLLLGLFAAWRLQSESEVLHRAVQRVPETLGIVVHRPIQQYDVTSNIKEVITT